MWSCLVELIQCLSPCWLDCYASLKSTTTRNVLIGMHSLTNKFYSFIWTEEAMLFTPLRNKPLSFL